MNKINITSCILHEDAGQLEVRLIHKDTELTTTYFLFFDDEDWLYSFAYDGNDKKKRRHNIDSGIKRYIRKSSHLTTLQNQTRRIS
jgi:YD repeat-containing protein